MKQKGALGYEKTIVVFPNPSPHESVTTVTESDEVVYVDVTKTPVTKLPNNVTRDEKDAEADIKAAIEATHTRGRPKKHKDAAARQRAYRERSAPSRNED